MEDNASVIVPWSAKVVSAASNSITGGRSDIAVVENVVRGTAGRGAAVGYIKLS